MNNLPDFNEFILPERWYIDSRYLDGEDKALILAFINKSSTYAFNNYIFNYIPHFINMKFANGWAKPNANYKEITFEQFKKHVLNKEIMEKKIIKYKLKDGCEKYLPALEKISSYFSKTVGDYSFYIHSSFYDDFKKAHVLELWFDPIYEGDKPNITINGYNAKFFETYVKFGCVEINKKVFIDIYHATNAITKYTNTNKEVESVTIGKGVFSKEDIEQIAEYYLNL